jgi:hypothetical protein
LRASRIEVSQKLPLLREVLPQKGDLALDIGCGDLRQHFFEDFYLKSEFKNIVGIDPYQIGIRARTAHYAGQDRFQFIHSSAESYRPASPVALCTIHHVIEHLKEESARTLLEDLKGNCEVIYVESPEQFEDGSGAVRYTGNHWMKHEFLADEKFMAESGFQLFYWYQANPDFSNAGYVWRQ